MRNVAGKRNCDCFILEELMLAGIPIVRVGQVEGEVPASVVGKLGNFTFERAWYYWRVKGDVPFSVAQELYDNLVGKKDVRVAGHCGCPPPLEWTEWRTADGKIILATKEKSEFQLYIDKGLLEATIVDGYYFTDEDPSTIGIGFVTSYHIDSQEGLNLFAKTMKKHGLA